MGWHVTGCMRWYTGLSSFQVIFPCAVFLIRCDFEQIFSSIENLFFFSFFFFFPLSLLPSLVFCNQFINLRIGRASLSASCFPQLYTGVQSSRAVIYFFEGKYSNRILTRSSPPFASHSGYRQIGWTDLYACFYFFPVWRSFSNCFPVYHST